MGANLSENFMSGWWRKFNPVPGSGEEGIGESSIQAAIADFTSNANLGPQPEFLGSVASILSASAVWSELSQLRNLLLECESPIEKVFAAAFWLIVVQRSAAVADGRPAVVFKDGITSGRAFDDWTFTIEPQARVGDYRIDFKITRVAARFDLAQNRMVKISKEILVECDGHDFHEKTKEQAARDKARDRILQSVGFHVFHYTGSEIWNDPVGCAGQVFDWLEDWRAAKDPE